MKLYRLSSIRTNNFTSNNLTEEFNQLWQTALSNKLDSSLPLYGLYYDYESNYKGDYTTAIATAETIGEPFALPEQAYQVYIVEQDIVSTWQTIWRDEDLGKINRSYLVDYEIHHSDGKVEIYIGIK